MSKFAGLGIASDKVFRLELTNPITGQPIRDAEGNAAYIDLLSSDSQAARDFDRKLLDRRVSQKISKPDARQLEADANERLVTLTKGWYLVALDGTVLDIPFNAVNARELYSEPSVTYVREQVAEAIDDRGNFSAN